jgi:hypothetical protein
VSLVYHDIPPTSHTKQDVATHTAPSATWPPQKMHNQSFSAQILFGLRHRLYLGTAGLYT